MSEPVNAKLNDKSVDSKEQILASEGAAYDIGGVLDKNAWTDQEIEERTRLLTELAYDSILEAPV